MLLIILLAVGFILSPSFASAQTHASLSDSTDIIYAPEWLDFGSALNEAASSNRIVLVDVYSPSCGWCARLQKEVYGKKEVYDYLKSNFEIARLDIKQETKKISFKGYSLTAPELASGLGAEGTPTVVFLTSAGEYITRVPGFIEADEFMHILRYISKGNYKSQSYQDYRLQNP